ncbi:MAG: hypothetical protein AAGL99_09580 [Pseudomonadota bacterium]
MALIDRDEIARVTLRTQDEGLLMAQIMIGIVRTKFSEEDLDIIVGRLRTRKMGF